MKWSPPRSRRTAARAAMSRSPTPRLREQPEIRISMLNFELQILQLQAINTRKKMFYTIEEIMNQFFG
jgi:hypothetical protein